MNEITFQAVQFLPRLISVVALLSLTWLVAKIAQRAILRTAAQCNNGKSQNGISKTIANLAFWATLLIMSPFVLGAAGVDASWTATMQNFVGTVFDFWPIWMVVSLLVAGISFVISGVPKLFVQLKGSFDPSHKELHS